MNQTVVTILRYCGDCRKSTTHLVNDQGVLCLGCNPVAQKAYEAAPPIENRSMR